MYTEGELVSPFSHSGGICMEAVVLIGGFLYIAVVGYLAMDRLGRFWDKGGISPYWD